MVAAASSQDMRSPIARRLSHAVGWLADRRVPRVLRTPIYRCYCAATGARAEEAELALTEYPSLGAFFVRRLKPGLRIVDADPLTLLSPCEGTLQAAGAVHGGSLIQAKGRSYSVCELIGAQDEGLEGALALTIYLSPRDYHRVHAPFDARLAEVRWLGLGRASVAPRVLAKKERVLITNERAVLVLETSFGQAFLVMVGALNVGRIRVVGVEPGGSPPPALAFRRGDELARFEMGSTVVLILPGGRARAGLVSGSDLRLFERLGALPFCEPVG